MRRFTAALAGRRYPEETTSAPAPAPAPPANPLGYMSPQFPGTFAAGARARVQVFLYAPGNPFAPYSLIARNLTTTCVNFTLQSLAGSGSFYSDAACTVGTPSGTVLAGKKYLYVYYRTTLQGRRSEPRSLAILA